MRTATDSVFIRGLRVDTIIGVNGWERELRQTLVIDLEMANDIQPAAASDDVADALDYAAVASRLLAFIKSSRFQLIETLAEQVAAIVMQEFQVPWLRLRVCKPGAVAQAEEVGVVIERSQVPSQL